jgi:hypothetical protein
VVASPLRMEKRASYSGMLEWFTDTLGRQRLVYGLIGLGINVVLLYFVGIIWFWLWAVAIVLLLSSMFGEW